VKLLVFMIYDVVVFVDMRSWFLFDIRT